MTSGGPEAPRRRDAEATRRAILDAAAEVSTRNGYDGTVMRDVARLAGSDTRLITRYFGSKEGLFAQVVDEAFRKPLLTAPGFNHEVAVDLLSGTTTRNGLLLTLRSVGTERAAEIMARASREALPAPARRRAPRHGRRRTRRPADRDLHRRPHATQPATQLGLAG
jgi:AcrR family transcriptional regulator